MPTVWTNINKATGNPWTKVTYAGINKGQPIGLLLALTYALNVGTASWTNVNKASGTSWTKITKAT